MRGLGATAWVVLVGAAIVAAAMQLPLHPGLLEPTLDGSFAMVLHHAAAQPLAERPQLISTYGPLGFSHFSFYLPQTFAAMLAVRAALAAVLCWAIAWVGWAGSGSPWGAALALLAGAPFLNGPDARCFVLLALVPLLELAPARPPTALRLALGAALGVLALVKVTFVTAALLVLAPLGVLALLRRRVPVSALAAAVTVLVGWWATGLGAAAFAAYLDWSFRDITPGYTPAMQLRTSTALVVHAAAVSLALLAWASALAWRRLRGWWWAPVAAFAGVVLLQFKAGFVRADIHVYTTAFAVWLEAVLLAFLGAPRRRATWLAAALAAALSAPLLAHALAENGVASARLPSPRELAAGLRALPALLRGDDLAAAHAARARELRAMLPLPPFDGGVDMIAFQQSLLLAGGASYRPRPVFQSYMAYTPRLARANAAYLGGPTAPRWLLVDPTTIDGRFPTIDDAAVWPVLLGAYRAAGRVGPYALFERRSEPRPPRLVPLGTVDARTDQPIAVPSAAQGPIWARIAVDDSLGERLVTQLFAAPYEYLDVVYTTNAAWRARLVPAIAADGFLLSPVIGTVDALLALSSGDRSALENQIVRSVRVHVASPFGGPTAPRTVHVEFSRLEP